MVNTRVVETLAVCEVKSHETRAQLEVCQGAAREGVAGDIKTGEFG